MFFTWLRTLNEIRTFFSENPNAEFWKTFKLGRAKRKGVGGKEFLPALAFPPPLNFPPEAGKRANEAGAPTRLSELNYLTKIINQASYQYKKCYQNQQPHFSTDSAGNANHTKSSCIKDHNIRDMNG